MAYPDAVLAALSDPTRRAVLELVGERPRPVGELAEELPITRPAVSQHLRVLRDAGLLTETRDGTRRIYALQPSGIKELVSYLQRFWVVSLDSYKRVAEARDKERS
ncbi:MAG TPA: metalloregulator ArsR/SmtB family transcription factor [Acidimicrobiales bacterium]|jgi:DNA-binding transcriptional ArsR family regulator|nr:metalloregulator ArsR/SmtB family transcription factor [Acidimicrobiales bacterium]